MTSSSTDRRYGVNSNMAIKVPCRAATTANLTLSGEQTIDGVACVTGDRVLVKNQTTGANNGIYLVDTGDWTRSLDFDGVYDVVQGTTVYINGGTANAGLFYSITTANPITIGSTSVAFAVISPSSPITFPTTLANGGTGINAASNAALLSALGLVQCTSVGGTANAITCTIGANTTSYRTDQVFELTPASTNTGSVTLTPTPSGASALAGKNIFWNGAACVGGELVAGVSTLLYYDGTQLNIANGRAHPDGQPVVVNATDRTKKLKLSLSGLTTATTRTITVSDRDFAIGKSPTRQVFTTGSGTYTTPAGATRINVRLVGAGAGGTGNGASAGAAGGNTTFGTLTASGAAGAAGGTASGGDINIPGGAGGGLGQTATANNFLQGGHGGNGAFGGGGAQGSGNANGGNGATNSGAGGGGGGGASGGNSGSGGGAGGYVEKLITSPSATYSYGVGAGGAGTSGTASTGGTGAAGIIIVDEWYD